MIHELEYHALSCCTLVSGPGPGPNEATTSLCVAEQVNASSRSPRIGGSVVQGPSLVDGGGQIK